MIEIGSLKLLKCKSPFEYPKPATGKLDCTLWGSISSSWLGMWLLTSGLLRETYCNEKFLLQHPPLALTALHFLWLKCHIGFWLGARARQVIIIYSAGADRSPGDSIELIFFQHSINPGLLELTAIKT